MSAGSKSPKPAAPNVLKKHALSTNTIDVVELTNTMAAGSKFASNGIALVNGMSSQEIFKNMTMFGVRHVVQSKGPNRIERVKKTQEIISAGTEGMNDLPESLLLSPATFHNNFRFQSSKQKEDLIEQAVGLVASQSGGRRFVDDVRAIADEFFTNVIYNAFHGPNAKISRTIDVNLPDDKPGEIHILGSTNELMIAAFDLFGSLDLDALINRIHKSFSVGLSRSMSYGSGGAGIGCRLVLDRSQRYWVIVLPGLFSAFFSILPFGPDARSANLDHKDVHFLKFSR